MASIGTDALCLSIPTWFSYLVYHAKSARGASTNLDECVYAHFSHHYAGDLVRGWILGRPGAFVCPCERLVFSHVLFGNLKVLEL